MAPAVANPLYMGYKALYKTILEDSKRGIAKAMRVFTDKDNLPVLIHCIHGKHQGSIICRFRTFLSREGLKESISGVLVGFAVTQLCSSCSHAGRI